MDIAYNVYNVHKSYMEREGVQCGERGRECRKKVREQGVYIVYTYRHYIGLKPLDPRIARSINNSLL